MGPLEKTQSVGIVGAGTMGSGIAQLAARAGHRVVLFDVGEGASVSAKKRIEKEQEGLVARGKFTREEAGALVALVAAGDTIGDLAGCGLVIEAIVEDLDVKRRLFAALEDIVSPEALLATNTSSISVTAIARDLKIPQRLAGMHFFNPATIMKLVEVVSGLSTATETAERIFATAEAWGKTAVHAKSTPGFIVNRVARPFYGEALRLCEEQVADPATIDALMKEAAGFRMGPFELMDLIDHDVNHAVNMSVFGAYYQDPRFRPSNLQLELINAGRLGRKSGRGFYEYGEQAVRPMPLSMQAGPDGRPLEGFLPGSTCEVDGVWIGNTDGRTAHRLSAELGRPVILSDLIELQNATRCGFTASADVAPAQIDRFVATLERHEIRATQLPDWPGLVVMRTVAMLANEGFETVLQGVAEEAAVDIAMRLGVNYPRGPIGWAKKIGLDRVLATLDEIHRLTGDPRYRASLALRQAVDDVYTM